MTLRRLTVALAAFLFVIVPAQELLGAPAKKRTAKTTRTATTSKRKVAVKPKKPTRSTRRVARKVTPKKRPYIRSTKYSRTPSLIKGGPWREPTFADSTTGDWTAGEDPVVRRAAEEALGPYNGTVVVADPHTGRILALVNQKLALKSGYQPCSTIKIVAGLAALREGIVDRDTPVSLARRYSLNLTNALATSNNSYFAKLGEKLGFERLTYYGRLFGLGERAGLNIEGEQPGIFPATPPPGGLGLMMSFGHGISLTPLELTSILSMVANGGTLYYLQHPRSPEEVANFVPRVKRQVQLAPQFEELKPGMMGAVEFGTARRAGVNNTDAIFGKTGTCTDERSPTHLGWFGSFNDAGRNKLTVVVLLTGGKPVNGPVASGVAGAVYRNLAAADYFSQPRPISASAFINFR
jgi:cell division protein FtsI/penicillin-binding protein 2